MFDIIEIIQNTNPHLVLIYGLAIGFFHALEPDHLTAISTQLVKAKLNSSNQSDLKKISISNSLKGAFWGMGHTSSIFFVGIIVAGLSISLSSVFYLGTEALVGGMLLVLGSTVIISRKRLKHDHIHSHSHGDTIHTHAHSHENEHKHNHKSYLIGCIHGLAGSGAIVAMLASSMNNFESVFFFLTLFGIGSVIGMVTISAVMGFPLMIISKIPKFSVYLKYSTSGISLIFGTMIILDTLMKIQKINF